MDAKSLLDRISAKELSVRSREFLAPFTSNSQKVHIKIDGVIYSFKIVGKRPQSGFGVFKSIDNVSAKYLREATFDLVRSFLDLLPQQIFILSYQTELGWVGYPYNIESARKSIGLNGEVIIHAVTDCERFDVVVTRFDGLHFWYDTIFTGGNLQKCADIRLCFDPQLSSVKMKEKFSNVKQITPEDKTAFEMAVDAWFRFRKVSTEDRIKTLIESGGGKLSHFIVRGDNIEVKWLSASGNTYNSLVNQNLDVVTAGICLSSEDSKFHLKDLPFLISEGENRGVIHRTT